ncbi:MAG: cell division protein ZapE [Micavibrio aeruginosavorus]|uniref:Cell division protein ZapE n=1 Tax=Micavibrio aeruginosavorus TaxID=349221 RepID=A0A2W5PYS2_9BACT|nr:MAG: cell division protein ZapE [Micavibrio aeruginosavorus]
MQTLLEIYRAKIESGDIEADAEQGKAVKALMRLSQDLQAKRPFFGKAKPVKGVYMHGGVGRGKSMLMDLFFDNIAESKKRRVHFHAFMIETQDWLHAKRAGGAVDDLLPKYARYVADSVRVLCFDEFHVTDVADAMILSRLFTALLDHGVVVVATSNWPPDRLYEGGLQRERFLPFIALIKERLDIVHLDSDTDYREEAVQDLETYLYPLNGETAAKADKFFRHLSHGEPPREETVRVKGRDIPVKTAGGTARFTFSQLCEQPHGAEDYLNIVAKFHTVFLENIPRMGYDRNNEAKRLMTLIDVLYDARCRAVFTAEAPPEKLYHDSKYAYEFERTISRLKEMQSSSYQEVR